MNTTFFSNTIWYILLLFTSIIAIVVTLKYSPNRKFTFAFSFAVLGITYIIEVFLLLISNAYTYYPKIVKDEFMDAVLGNIFSQVSVSSTAVLVSVLNLSNIWILVFSIIYFLIDVLFVHLGIYEHNWYMSIYTLIGFIPYCWIVKKWYERILSKPNKLIYYITLFLGVFSIGGNSIITSLRLLEIQIFRADFYTDMSKNHTATGIIYGIILITILIALYKRKSQMVFKGIIFIFLFMCQYVLYKLNILYVKPGWFFIIAVLDLFGFYMWIHVIDHSLKKNDKIMDISISKT